MHHLFASVLLGLSLLSVSALADDCGGTVPSVTVTMNRMLYKTGGSFSHASGFGTHFSASGITDAHLKKMYVSKVWEPAPSNVKNVVVVSAGQSDIGGAPNAVTGQANGYAWWGSTGQTRSRQIDGNSIAAQVMDRFDPTDTVLVLIHDSQFRYEISEGQRTAVKNAFRSWIYSLADDPDLVYYVGSSRGGAMGLILGTELTQAGSFPNFSDALVVLQGIDPAFRHGEYGVDDYFDRVHNPLEDFWFQNYQAQELDIRDQFSDDQARMQRSMVKVITTGDSIVLFGEAALPWGEWSDESKRSGDDELTMLHVYDDLGQTFYEGNWTYQSHLDFGREYCTGPSEEEDQASYRTQPLLDHLDSALARLECNGRWTYNCFDRTGCAVEEFTCLCDTPYLSDGDGACVLDCPVGEVYDVDADVCVELCASEDNLAFNIDTGSCECMPEAHWSPDLGCEICETSDWDYYNQSCCPDAAPHYDSEHNECYADCAPDAYWEFDPWNNLGHCVDYCPPCQDPTWDSVCSVRDRRCYEVMTCVDQCEDNEVCGTTPNKFPYDVCVPLQVLGPVGVDPGVNPPVPPIGASLMQH